MQSCIGGINIEGLVGHNFGSLPASVIVVIVDLKHVICLNGTKGIDVVGGRLLLENSARLNLQVAGQKCFLHRGETKA